MIRYPLECFLIFCSLMLAVPVVASPQSESTSLTLSQAITSSTLASFEYPEPSPPQSNYDLLRVRIKQIIHDQSADPSRIGIFIQDCSFGIVPFEWNNQIGFVPGSTLKLVTTAAALDLLGPSFTYKTVAELHGKLSGNTFFGNLIVRGSGDPTIGSQSGLSPSDPSAVFRGWADAIKKMGIQRITGSVAGDDTYFDEQFEGNAWPLQNRGEWYLAQISALSYRDNCVDLVFRGGKRSGKPTEYEMSPDTKHVIFHNGTLTAAKGLPANVQLRRQEESNLINAVGTIPPREEFHARASVHNPSMYFTTVLRETLLSEKIAIDGTSVVGRAKIPAIDPTTGSWPIASQVSPPLKDIIRIANEYGQNFYADMLLKTLGKVERNLGSFQSGVAVLHDFLQKADIDDNDSNFMDGSGLSTANSVSAKVLGKLLVHMASHPYGDAYRNSLCQPGQYGPLEHRMANLNAETPPIANRVEAISGVMGGNYALAGYATTAGSVRFAFAFMINDSRLDHAKANGLLDSMAEAIVRSPISKNH